VLCDSTKYYYYLLHQLKDDISFRHGYIHCLYTTKDWIFATIDISYLQDGLLEDLPKVNGEVGFESILPRGVSGYVMVEALEKCECGVLV